MENNWLELIKSKDEIITKLQSRLNSSEENHQQEIQKILLEKEKLITESKKYTIGSGFLDNEKDIEARMTTLNYLPTFRKLNKKIINSKENLESIKKIGHFDYALKVDLEELIKFKNTIELLSGIKRNNSLNIDSDVDFKMWILSILKQLLQEFSNEENLDVVFILRRFIFNVMDMINLELNKNNLHLQSNKINSIISLKQSLYEFYEKSEILENTPSTETRLSIDGDDKYEEFPINQQKISSLETKIYEILINIKTKINIICDELERLLVSKGEIHISKLESPNLKSSPIKPNTKNKDLLIEE